jgi:ribosomal protein L16 Arg81 hydroxylase
MDIIMDVTDTDRSWLAENIIRGSNLTDIKDVLIQHGRHPHAVNYELDLALKNIYVHGALKGRELFIRRTDKANWMLDTVASLRNKSKKYTTIEMKDNMTLEEFLEDYYYSNRPVILDNRQIVKDWPAFNKWNIDYLIETYGEKRVEIQTKRDDTIDYDSQINNTRTEVNFGEWLKSIKDKTSNDEYMVANNGTTNLNIESLRDMWNEVGQLPFCLDPGKPPYGYFFLGPKGTITPAHHDLTNNLQTQVVGTKRVHLVDSLQQPNMYNHLYIWSRADLSNVDYSQHPLLKNINIIEATLEPGQSLFIPVGWWHRVESLDFSVSITSTNFKADNNFPARIPMNGNL